MQIIYESVYPSSSFYNKHLTHSRFDSIIICFCMSYFPYDRQNCHWSIARAIKHVKEPNLPTYLLF